MTEQIGNYNILKKIGAGGMAQVYLAVHKDVPNLKVVLKVLSDPRLVERFKQEADKLALLDGHGHICQIKHFFNHGDEIIIAMEYIDGSTLEDMIIDKENMPADTAVQIISSVLETLAFAHQKGIYHRDIKPGNIMVDKRGHVKIIDFGIAKGESDPNLTIAGSSCGTPAYMPPEQFNPTDAINYALTDIYAIGTTLFFMLTGKLPYEGDNAFALRDAKLFNDPIMPRSINSDIPKQLEDIIITSIDKDPENRYQSVEEMKAAIDGIGITGAKADLTEHVVAGKSDTPLPPTKDSKPKKNLIPFIAGGAAVIILAIIAIFMLGGDDLIVIPTPRLTSPANGDTLDIATPVIRWQGAEGLVYSLEIADDQTFTSPQMIPDLTSPEYTIAIDMADGQYYWRVSAQDSEGNKSGLSAANGFYIQTIEELPPGSVTGLLELTLKPRGDIYIDGQAYGKRQTSLQTELTEGSHIIKTENSTSTQKRIVDTIMIVEGETTKLNHTFVIPPSPPKKTYGEVRIGSKPYIGAVIFIDGKVQNNRTNNTFRMETGTRTVKAVLTIEGVEHEKTETIAVTKNGSHKLIFDFNN